MSPQVMTVPSRQYDEVLTTPLHTKTMVSAAALVTPEESSHMSTSSTSNSDDFVFTEEEEREIVSPEQQQKALAGEELEHVCDPVGDDHHWEFVSRWSDLKSRRLDLSRQRVELEQRLFEFAELKRCREHEATEWEPFVEPAGTSKKQDPLDCPLSPRSTNKLKEYPTLCSLRWEQVDFPDGQVYEGQVLVLLKRSLQPDPHAAQKATPQRRRLFGKKKKPTESPKKSHNRLTTTTEWIRHGYGCNRWPDGQIYRGAWQYNSRQGRGTHAWPDGRCVTGGWKHGHLEGQIFFSWPDASTYDGDAHNGKKCGRGVHTWDDGRRIYSGQYKNGVEEGFGTLTETSDGYEVHSKFRGQFKQGQRHGYGVQIWKHKTYDGEWRHNTVHGRGKLTWNTSGATYTGEFSNGRYHGSGRYQSARKEYLGEWKDGVPHGTGETKWLPHGATYRGQYRAGKRDGFGRMEYPDKSVYWGGWKNNQPYGPAIHVSADGDLLRVGASNVDKQNKRLRKKQTVQDFTFRDDQQVARVVTPRPPQQVSPWKDAESVSEVLRQDWSELPLHTTLDHDDWYAEIEYSSC